MSLALGIDIGGTHCGFALMDSNGHIYHRHDVPTHARDGGEALIQRLMAETDRLLHGRSVAGIGIGSAGQIDFASGTCRFATDALPGWTGMPIASRFREAFGLPVWVENDANAAALGEHTYGAGRRLTDVVCLTLGTGIGGGVISGGRLLRGAHAAGGELGHIPVELDGAPCACGARGCVEAYASATGIARMAREAGLTVTSVRDLYERAARGEEGPLAITRKAARYLTQAIVALVAAYDPQAVLLGGGVSRAGALLFDPVRAALAAHPFVRGRCEARPCILGHEAGVIGAAAQVFLYGNEEV